MRNKLKRPTNDVYIEEKEMNDVVDSIMLLCDDPRIFKDGIERIKRKEYLGVFSFLTLNIYLCNAFPKETRRYMKRDKSISFNDALIKIVVYVINHESMHKSLFISIGKDISAKYDVIADIIIPKVIGKKAIDHSKGVLP